MCDAPVNLLSLFPTLTELCGIPPKPNVDGPSLLPLLKNAESDWPHESVTYLATPGTYAVSGNRYRYIHYSDGSEELYDIASDPYEWTNLANKTEAKSTLTAFRESAPKEFAEFVAPSIESLNRLTWQPLGTEPAPPSKPDGNPFPVYFENGREEDVELFWMDRNGGTKSYGVIGAGRRQQQQTRPGAVWMIAEAKSGKPLGYFIVQDRTARAIVPE